MADQGLRSALRLVEALTDDELFEIVERCRKVLTTRGLEVWLGEPGMPELRPKIDAHGYVWSSPPPSGIVYHAWSRDHARASWRALCRGEIKEKLSHDVNLGTPDRPINEIDAHSVCRVCRQLSPWIVWVNPEGSS